MSIFTKVLQPSVKTSKFNLSHDIKLSFDMGELIPSCVFDVLPGDKFKINVENMLRFAPLISPVMHKIKVITNFFFVPNRLIWPGNVANQNAWEMFITGQNPDAVPPTFNQLSNVNTGSIGDYLGFPVNTQSNNNSGTYSAFPLQAYNIIYDYWYRDQNLQPEVTQLLTEGNNAYITTGMAEKPYYRAKNHDYFTSALPFAQKGDAVTLPLLQDEEVPIKFDPDYVGAQLARYRGGGNDGQIIAEGEPWDIRLDEAGTTGHITAFSEIDAAFSTADLDLTDSHTVNINEEASTVETLRKAFRLQEWLEKNARGGTRYSEHLKAHFNVSAQDSRLQNPEYIGGHVQNMIISEVLTTAESTGTTQPENVPTGSMAGHGISVSKGKNFTYSAKEHGWIIGIISVTPNTAYSYGSPRMFNRKTMLDYAFPSFANLGEQEILNKEIYIGNEQLDKLEETFGYIPRYAEYKYVNNRIAGDFRNTLNFWHCGLEFANAPALNDAFIKTDPTDYDKIFAVSSSVANTIYAHIFNNVSAIRKLPKYGIPTI